MSRFPAAPSYAEMGKSKPVKTGRNKREPRPFKDVRTFKVESNRSERRSELNKKGHNAINSKRLQVTSETIKKPERKLKIMPVVKQIKVKMINLECQNKKCGKLIKPDETAIKVRIKGGRAEYYCSDKCYQAERG